MGGDEGDVQRVHDQSTILISDDESDKPHYFDCDPDCHEPYHPHLAKAETLVCGREFGGEHI